MTVATGEGNARYFSSPYHGGTYELDGRLKKAAHLEKSVGFDASRCPCPD